MNNQSGMSNQNELDLTNLKYYMELIDGLNSELNDSVDFILPKNIEQVARYNEVSSALEKMTHMYPVMCHLLVDLKKQIDELPEFIEVEK